MDALLAEDGREFLGVVLVLPDAVLLMPPMFDVGCKRKVNSWVCEKVWEYMMGLSSEKACYS